ncbi:MAG: GAF domain-containing protein [Phycisphaerae bacterium]|nr:GAF domain-containing protein [Phycisphaerae bacterium]
MTSIPDLSVAATLEHALRAVIEHFRADTGTLHVLEDGLLVLKASHGDYPPPVLEIIRRIPIGKGMAGLAAERREPITVCNLQSDTSGDVRPGAKMTGMEGAIVVPMFDDRGELKGTLGIANRAARTWTEDETKDVLVCARKLAARVGA